MHCPEMFRARGLQRNTAAEAASSLCGRPAADGRSVELWTEDHEGWLCMKGSAEIDQ